MDGRMLGIVVIIILVLFLLSWCDLHSATGAVLGENCVYEQEVKTASPTGLSLGADPGRPRRLDCCARSSDRFGYSRFRTNYREFPETRSTRERPSTAG